MYKQLWREQSLRLSQTEQLLQQSEELSILREKESYFVRLSTPSSLLSSFTRCSLAASAE